jgi:Uma2 family endonuclease
MTATAKKLPATLEDFLAIPEEERFHELIDGELIERAAPSGEHGGAQAYFSWSLISRFGHRPGGRWPGGWWFAVEVELALPWGQVVRPDLVAWRRDRVPERPTGALVSVLPDWVCEVLSTDRGRDLIKKKRVYHRAKIPHYWIADPAERTLSVNRWSEAGYTEVLSAERGELVRAEPFDAVELSVDALFGDSDDPEE